MITLRPLTNDYVEFFPITGSGPGLCGITRGIAPPQTLSVFHPGVGAHQPNAKPVHRLAADGLLCSNVCAMMSTARWPHALGPPRSAKVCLLPYCTPATSKGQTPLFSFSAPVDSPTASFLAHMSFTETFSGASGPRWRQSHLARSCSSSDGRCSGQSDDVVGA